MQLSLQIYTERGLKKEDGWIVAMVILNQLVTFHHSWFFYPDRAAEATSGMYYLESFFCSITNIMLELLQ
jgi:hypothetical protein